MSLLGVQELRRKFTLLSIKFLLVSLRGKNKNVSNSTVMLITETSSWEPLQVSTLPSNQMDNCNRLFGGNKNKTCKFPLESNTVPTLMPADDKRKACELVL